MNKKILLFVILVLLSVILYSCGPEVISLIPVYKGEEVTDTHHEFTNDDFDIIVTYDDGSQATVDEFELEVQGMKNGYYILEVTVDGFTEEAYVPINVKVYPSDMEE